MDSMSALGISTKELPGYLDKMAKASSKSNTSVAQLGEAMVIAGGTFKNLNTPMEESNAILGIMANRGLKGSEAANSLNSIMINLTTGAGQAGKAMKELDINAFDSQGQFKGMGAVLKEVNEKTKGLSQEQQNMYLSMIGGKTQLTALQALTSGVGEEFDKLQADIKNSNGALNEMAATMQDNLKGKITQLMSALEGLMISMSDVLIPIVEKVVEKFQEIAGGFSTLIQKMKDGESFSQAFKESFEGIIPESAINGIIAVKNLFAWIIDNKEIIISSLAGIATGMLVFKAVVVVQKMVAAFTAFRTATEGATIAQWAMNAAMTANPIGIIIAAIAGLVAGIIALWNTNEDFRNAIIKIWNSIKKMFGELGPFFTKLWEGITKVFKESWKAISDFFTEGVPKFIANIVKWISELPNKIAVQLNEVYKKVSEWGTKLIKWVATEIPKVIKNIVGFFAKIPGKIWDQLIKTKEKISNWGTNLISWGKTYVIDPLKNLFTSQIEGFKEIGKNIFTGLWDGLKFTWDLLIFWVTGGPIIEFVKLFSDIDLLEIGKNIIDGLINGVKQKWQDVKNIVGDVAGSIKNKFKEALGIHSPSKVFKGYGNNIVDGLNNGVKELIPKVEGTIKGLVDMTKTYMESTIGSLHKAQQAAAQLAAISTGGAGGDAALPSGDMSGAYHYGRPDKETGYGDPGTAQGYILTKDELNANKYIDADYDFDSKAFKKMIKKVTDKDYSDLNDASILGIFKQIFPQYNSSDGFFDGKEVREWVESQARRMLGGENERARVDYKLEKKDLNMNNYIDNYSFDYGEFKNMIERVTGKAIQETNSATKEGFFEQIFTDYESESSEFDFKKAKRYIETYATELRREQDQITEKLNNQSIGESVASMTKNKSQQQPQTQTTGTIINNNMYGMDFSNYQSTAEQIERNTERARWQIK